MLARRGKNLTIEKDREGLYFSVDKLPDTALANETRELIKQDILQDVSIGFLDVDSEVKDNVRTYRHIELHEISPFYLGAILSQGKSVQGLKKKSIYRRSVFYDPSSYE